MNSIFQSFFKNIAKLLLFESILIHKIRDLATLQTKL